MLWLWVWQGITSSYDYEMSGLFAPDWSYRSINGKSRRGLDHLALASWFKHFLYSRWLATDSLAPPTPFDFDFERTLSNWAPEPCLAAPLPDRILAGSPPIDYWRCYCHRLLPVLALMEGAENNKKLCAAQVSIMSRRAWFFKFQLVFSNSSSDFFFVPRKVFVLSDFCYFQPNTASFRGWSINLKRKKGRKAIKNARLWCSQEIAN